MVFGDGERGGDDAHETVFLCRCLFLPAVRGTSLNGMHGWYGYDKGEHHHHVDGVNEESVRSLTDKRFTSSCRLSGGRTSTRRC